MSYVLAPALSFCETEGRCLFLDLRQDRYFCLGDGAAASFARLVAGLRLDAEDHARLTGMVAKRILRDAPGAAPPQPCHAPATPRASLFDTAERATTASVINALLMYRLVALRLRILGLERTLAALPKCRRNAGKRAATRAVMIASAFRQAGSFATTRDQCLAHSIAVAAGMRRHGLAAALIIGVHLRPFHAHCWVQHDDAVVNDSLDNVRDFTPILVLP